MRHIVIASQNLLIARSGLVRCRDVTGPRDILGLDRTGHPAWRKVLPASESQLDNGYYLITECGELRVNLDNAVFCSTGPRGVDGSFDLLSEDVRENRLEVFELHSQQALFATAVDPPGGLSPDLEYLLGAFCRGLHRHKDGAIIRIPPACSATSRLLEAATNASATDNEPHIIKRSLWDWLIITDIELANWLHDTSQVLYRNTPELFRLATSIPSRFVQGILDVTRIEGGKEEGYRTFVFEEDLRQLMYHHFSFQGASYIIKPIPYYRPLEVEVRMCPKRPPFACTQSFFLEPDVPFIRLSVADQYWSVICNLVILN
jgi:hypothetical protein